MRILMGALGVALVVIAGLYYFEPWIACIFAISSVLSFLCCLPFKSKILLGTLGAFAVISMFTMFTWFFHGVAIAHEAQQWYELDQASRYFAFLFGGFVMMLATSEFSCWMKGRDASSLSLISGKLRNGVKNMNKVGLSD